MNPIFNTLTTAILDNVEDQLANNEVSTNEELWDFFIEELGLTAEQADAAIALRPRYLGQIFLIGQSPLYQDNPVSFDPEAKVFKPHEPELNLGHNVFSTDELTDLSDAIANQIQDIWDYCRNEEGTGERVERLEALSTKINHLQIQAVNR
ncbi:MULTISPECIES: hypothetical protein [Pseudomonadaceae]|uniref:hypothetical protein n=1 Tax=Pseudomonadaceae TaxID=135621 RepID=UPI001F23461C|nr:MULTISPECIES: hypothetical protein [Pseudomonadaceae]MCQ4322710.1 hypothetical protein [Stutzerimonas stutzeri]